MAAGTAAYQTYNNPYIKPVVDAGINFGKRKFEEYSTAFSRAKRHKSFGSRIPGRAYFGGKLRLRGRRVARRRIGKKRYVKRKLVRRRKSSYKRNPMLKGIRIIKEYASVDSDQPEVVYRGHMTMPSELVLKAMGMALTKYIYSKNNAWVVNFEDAVSPSVTSHVELMYYPQPGSTTLSVEEIYIGTIITYQNIADAFALKFASLYNAYPEINFHQVRIRREDASETFTDVLVPIYDLTFHINSKSVMKIQNRSQGSLGAEADDVDNVPLEGRLYYGNGTGATVKDQHRVAQPFIGDDEDGLIFVDTAVNCLLEPPLPSFFNKVKGGFKVYVMPGQIKTSIISSKHHLPVNGFLKDLHQKDTTVDQQIWSKVGKFAFFGLEKVVDCTELPISVGYELQLTMDCWITRKGQPQTAQLFIKG